MKQPIPIENIYYLFCYAWDRFPEGKAIDVGRIKSPKIWDLLASVLVRGINRLIRRGLDRGYTEIEEDISAVRGCASHWIDSDLTENSLCSALKKFRTNLMN
jgi:5-methylcytosine-specific restriction enzyme subunit McrC